MPAPPPPPPPPYGATRRRLRTTSTRSARGTIGAGQNDDPAPWRVGPPMAAGGSPDGHRPQGPVPDHPPPSDPHAGARRGGGLYRAAGGARHRDGTDTTAEADPPAANPTGRAWRPRTPDSPGRARRGEGRTRLPQARPLARHRARASSGPRAVAPNVGRCAGEALPGPR